MYCKQSDDSISALYIICSQVWVENLILRLCTLHCYYASFSSGNNKQMFITIQLIMDNLRLKKNSQSVKDQI